MSIPEAKPGDTTLDFSKSLDLRLQVGKYDVQKLLGKGATGTVYLAKDTFTGKEVALKTIEPEVFRDPEFGTVYRSQFLQEASLAGKLRHPYIVAILDAVVGEDSGYIAMELVTGGDLSRHVTARDPAAGSGRAADRLQVLRRARIRGEGGHRPPRHQAREHHARERHRGEDRRLRRRVPQEEPGGADRRARLALLHVARADRGREDPHVPQRHVLARRRAVRAPHRQEALPWQQHRGPDGENPQARPGTAERGCAPSCRRRSTPWCCAR